MNQKNHNRITGWGDYVTSTISVTLVLFILGLVGVVNITFSGINRQIKEKMGFTVILADSVAPAVIDSLKQECGSAPYVSGFKYLSADEVLAEETAGEGGDLVELLGVNPYAPMIEVRLSAEYADVDSIAKITPLWEECSEVQEVTVNTEMIGNLNRNANLINMVLILMAGALLLISFVLINNTVRLTVYARRFLIHTMKLVGAKGSFIRRPFMINNAAEGVIAGVLGAAMLGGLVGWAKNWDEGLESLLPWNYVGVVMGVLPVLGVIICAVAALFATNRYLRKDYDEMFK
ncbi:MAG: permease-like cell division protein FtsX [Muribaculaceae bacterium]|nr:permease-like cell division protein FtsX [Muribaculaceae bacterium]